MALTPIGAKVLVRDLEKDEMTPGGVILPQDADGTSRRSLVLAIGPQAQQTAVGDTVVRTKFSGVAVEVRGEPESLRIIEETDILAYDNGDEGGGSGSPDGGDYAERYRF